MSETIEMISACFIINGKAEIWEFYAGDLVTGRAQASIDAQRMANQRLTRVQYFVGAHPFTKDPEPTQ